MKKIKLSVCMLALGVSALAQKPSDMTAVWSTDLSHRFEASGLSEKLNIVHGSNEKNFSAVNAETGKLIWNKEFKEIFEKIKKVDLQIPLYQSKAVLLFDKKMGKDQMVVVDIETGKYLWSTDKYQGIEDADEIVYVSEIDAYAVVTKEALTMVKARTGEEIWSTTKLNTPIAKYLVDRNENTITIANMNRTFLGALFKGFKNQIIKLNLKNGEVIFDIPYFGLVEKKIVTREAVMSMDVQGDKLFVQLNGLQVFDYKTGKPLWSCTYDVTFEDISVGARGNVQRKGIYGAVAPPLFDGEYVYIVEMKSRRSQYIKKYEAISGKLVWTSPEIKEARVIPGIYKIGDMITLQVGGAVEAQYISTSRDSEGNVTTYRVKKYVNVKPYNVQAFKASDGTQVWESENFKKGISNMFPNGENLIICSGKALYSLNAQTGKDNYEVPLKEDDISNAEKIINPSAIGPELNKDNVIIIGEKGVSAHNMKTGAKVWSVRTKDGDFNGIYGTTAFYQKENFDQYAIDVNSGKATFYNARKNSESEYTADGKYMYIFEKKTLTKLSTK
jgi:outer membrane protein assembly factor BamB